MDQAILVANRIDDGRRLIDTLADDGFDISAAFWICSDIEDQLSLDVVSSNVDRDGLFDSYLKVIAAIKRLPDLNITPDDILLLRTDHPLATSFVKFMNEHSEYVSMRLWGTLVGNFPIEEAYIYSKRVTA